MKQPKLRVAIVRQKYTTHGGAELFVQNMLDSLQKHAEVELTLITRKWEQKNQTQVHILKCDPFYFGRLWRDWSFARKACQIIKQHQHEFDLVQSHERILCADIYRAGEGVHREWLIQRQRVRPWWNRILDRLSPYHRYVLRQEKHLFESPKIRALITNSETTKAEIIRHFPNHKAPVTVIPNAVDQEKFHPRLRTKHRAKIRSDLNIPDECHVSLFVGSGYERKGVDQLLNIFTKLSQNHQLIIIGKDKNQAAFEEKAKTIGLAKRVHFLGPQMDVRPYLGAADLFIFPSLYDPLPNSTLEAVASGLPMIASKTTGAADITSALGIEPPDPLDTSAWIAEIKRASEHKMPLANLTENTQKAMSKKIWALYQKVMEEKNEAL
jgi:UDP-glucose:(heptosyl)LPS alpha-1,3-glucosyltransferase